MTECTISDELGGKWIHIDGRIDSLTSSDIRRKIEGLIQEGQRTIIIDLEAVNYVSSAGLRVFLDVQKKLKKAGGEVSLLKPNANVMDLLEMSCLDKMFRIASSREEMEGFLQPEVSSSQTETVEIHGASFQTLSLSASPGKLFRIGSQEKLASSSYTEDDAITVGASRIQYGTGLATLGESFEECKDFFGEAMVIGRNLYFYPAVKRPAVDFMLCPQEDSNIQYQFLHGFGFNGDFSHIISFEGKEGFIELPQLLDAVFEIVKTNRLGIVFLAESKGFWGMHLMKVPLPGNRPSNSKDIFDTENFTQWMNFPIEPSDNNHIIAGTGIAVKDCAQESEEVRELLGKDKNFHFHAGVFAEEPLSKQPDRFEEELKRVITNLEVSKVQHVLGQTKFSNGLIGIIQLED